LNRPDGVHDLTPGGARFEQQQGDYRAATPLDDDRITYVALWAKGDFADAQHANTSRLDGAHLNQVFELGPGLEGHERIIKEPDVFSAFLPFLNRQAPGQER
jgi:hypothetical protein